MIWPTTAEGLAAEQDRLANASPIPWRPPHRLRVGACFVCFPRGIGGPGRSGDAAWAAACVGDEIAVERGRAAGSYQPSLLALREGRLLERAVLALAGPVDVLLVNATGLDHPRCAGLALHVGAVLDLPTVGVTHRPLRANGEWPPEEKGASSPLILDGQVVGAWLRTRNGARPLAVHAAWRTNVEAAVDVVLAAGGVARTPRPLRIAREAARRARALDEASTPRPNTRGQHP